MLESRGRKEKTEEGKEGREGLLEAEESQHRRHLLVEQYPGAHDELEDVLQRFHGLIQLVADAWLLGIVHIVS